MKSVAKYGLNKRKHFKITLTEEADKVGVWFSILGDRDVLETLEGLGELTEVVYVTEAKLKKLFLKKEAGENVETTLKEVAQYLKELKLTLARQLERKHQLAELWKQYLPEKEARQLESKLIREYQGSVANRTVKL